MNPCAPTRESGHRGGRMLPAALAAACAVGLLAAPASAAEGGGKLNFGDLGQAIAAMLAFIVLMLVLGRWVWKPLVVQLKRREESINATIQNAEKRQREAEELLADYRQRLDRVDAEAQKLLATSRAQAAQDRERALAEAREEARIFARNAKEEIREAREEAMAELRDVAADVATDLAGRVIGRSLTPEDHRRLVEQSLEEIRTQGLEKP